MKILTFDIEEWFHLLDNPTTNNITEWDNFESRIHNNMERILTLLDRTKTNATFFCLGWIAEKYPEIIKEINEAGYEIGSHSYYHQLVYKQNIADFSHDLEHSVNTIEEIIGKKVKYYRAPGFSIQEDSRWAFEVMQNQGIEVDCSVFPAIRAHGGFPSYKHAVPSILRFNDCTLKELPISYATIFRKPLVFSGGGYFRLSPYQLIKLFTNKSNYVMTYFHPRDFDPGQPVLKDLSVMRRFKSYVGLSGSTIKLEQWLMDYEFIDIGTAVNRINWNVAPVVDI
jgi:peptidoglycan-N-acetylglucosamine deacetylase